MPDQNNQYNVNEFAGLIRSKYPNKYDDMDDLTLTKAVLAKYPTYSTWLNGMYTPEGFTKQQALTRKAGMTQQMEQARAAQPWWSRPLISADFFARALEGEPNNATIRDRAQNPDAYGITDRMQIAQQGWRADANDVISSMTNPVSVALNFLHIPLASASGRVTSAAGKVEQAINMQKALRGVGASAEVITDASRDVLQASRGLRQAQTLYTGVRSATTAANVALAASSAPDIVRGTAAAFDSSKSDVERASGALEAAQGLSNAAIAGISARQVGRSAPSYPQAAPFTPSELARIRAATPVDTETQTSSLTGGMDKRQQDVAVQSRIHPPGTTLNPYVTRPTEGRIPLAPDRANMAKAQGFGNAVIPLPNAGPRPAAPDSVARVPFGPAPEAKPGDASATTRGLFDMQQRLAAEGAKFDPNALRNAINPVPGLPTTKALPEGAPPVDSKPTNPSMPDRNPGESMADWAKRTGLTIGEAPSPGHMSAPNQAPNVKQEEPKPFVSAKVPTEKGLTVTDLREMDASGRHDWINKNVNIGLSGVSTAAEARAKLGDLDSKGLIPKSAKTEVVSYIDKDGVQHWGAKYHFPDISGGAPNKPDPTISGEVEQTPYEDIALKVRASEDKFNEMTGGAHKHILNQLYETAQRTLGADAPREGVMTLYNKGVSALIDAVRSNKGIKEYMKAFEVVTKKGEGGFFNPVGRKGLSDQTVAALARIHVESMLDKWEKQGAPPVAKMLDPAFRSAVYGANDPNLEVRYESLLAGKTSNAIDNLSAIINGVARSQLTRGSLRENLAISADSHEVRLKRLDTYIKSWNQRTLADSLHFIDAIEQGNINSIPDETDRSTAQELRRLLDAKRDEIRDLGTGKLEHFYENYFPHLWKFGITDAAKNIIGGRRSFAGPASFLKPRTYDTFSEGIAAGLEPVTYNPVQMALLKLHEMDRYLVAHRTFNELKSYGLVQAFESRKVPDGWVALNDNMFRAGADRKYYAPADVARPINNHLSPGLRGNLLYNTVAGYNNISNQFNLGFSAFHAVETGVNSMVSEFGLGLQQLSRGKVTGAIRMVGSPLAPFRDYLVGTRLMQEVMEPGRFAEMADIHRALQMAGGRIRMGAEFKNQAKEALHNSWLEFENNPSLTGAGRLAYRSIGRGLELLSVPLMEKFVPRIKLGAFAAGAQDILDRLGPDAPRELVREHLSKLWDSIDNRYGQVVYDNLFWNRTAKDLAHLTIRSVGWNMGTIRELGGGVWDLKDVKQNGLSTRTAYTLGLLAYTALLGYGINKMYNQHPDGLIDLMYPKTGKIGPDGNPERVYLKTYIHDAYSFYHAPGQTVLNKTAPIWHQISDIYQNADYFGNQIRPIQPTTTDTLTSADTYSGIAKYLLTSQMPFSISNMQERMKQGESVGVAMSSTAAILPAPRWVGQSKAQSLAYELYRTHLQRGPNDPTVSDRIQRYHQLAAGYSSGQYTDKDVESALKSGEITTKQYDGILAADDTGQKDGEMSALNRHLKLLTGNEFLRVLDYTSPEERSSMEDRFYQKWDKAIEDGDTDLSKRFEQREKLFRKR